MWGVECVRVKGFFSVGFGPGLDSMSPTRSRRSTSMQRGRMAGFPKTGWPGLGRGGIDGYNLHSPPDCGAPTTCSLCPLVVIRAITGCPPSQTILRMF